MLPKKRLMCRVKPFFENVNVFYLYIIYALYNIIIFALIILFFGMKLKTKRHLRLSNICFSIYKEFKD